MITIELVTKEGLAEYWDLHWAYLNRDLFPYASLGEPMDAEDHEYFRSDTYRGVIERYMDRTPDTAFLLYFVEDGNRVGCAQYVTYHSEDGKCLLMDFWVLPAHRGGGMGRRCFAALHDRVQAEGAKYIEINVSNERNRNFWLGEGFADAGKDEHGEPLMRRTV